MSLHAGEKIVIVVLTLGIITGVGYYYYYQDKLHRDAVAREEALRAEEARRQAVLQSLTPASPLSQIPQKDLIKVLDSLTPKPTKVTK